MAATRWPDKEAVTDQSQGVKLAAAVLVELGAPRGGQDARAADGEEYLAAMQVYGRLIGFPELKPHDVRHGVAMEVYEQHHDLEEVRALRYPSIAAGRMNV